MSLRELAALASAGDAQQLRKALKGDQEQIGVRKALKGAAKQGQMECVKILLKTAKPLYDNSRALVVAFDNRDWELFDLLVPYSDIGQAQTWIRHKKQDVWETVLAHRQKLVLDVCVGTDHKGAVGRKI